MSRKISILCPVVKAMNVIGDTWSVLILRDLFLKQQCRFQDFQDSIQGIAPSTLSNRLKRLEADGVIQRQIYSDHPPRADYHLTQKGQTLGPIILAMKKWGEQFPD